MRIITFFFEEFEGATHQSKEIELEIHSRKQYGGIHIKIAWQMFENWIQEGRMVIWKE
jgi:hypothetical protein